MSSFPDPPQAYRVPAPQQPHQATAGKPVWVVLAIILVMLVGGTAICCGGMFFVGSWGLDIVAQDIARQLRDDPVIQEEIGEIEEISMNLTASATHADDETFVYDVRGSKGSGELTVQSVTLPQGGEEILSASLRTEDGRQIDIDVEP